MIKTTLTWNKFDIMTKYNFDKPVNRKGTNCSKWDKVPALYGKKNLIAMWVADMDFLTPKFFTDAYAAKTKNSVLGYGMRPEAWSDSIIAWFKERYNWKIIKDQLGFVPGIVVGLSHALRCFTKPGDKVLIMPPVYHPFRMQIEAARCKVVNSPLKIVESKSAKGYISEDFEIDFADLEKKMKGCKVMILCNPHNPGGRVWSRAELKKIADICLKNNVLVFSDEIHCDLMNKKHVPFALVNARQAANTITFHAPSKTFNCAGIGASEWVATNRELWTKFTTYLNDGEFDEGHHGAFLPAQYLYSKRGKEWLEQAMAYITANINYVEEFLRENFTVDTLEFSGRSVKVAGADGLGEEQLAEAKIGKTQLITMIRPEASFLIFIDFRRLGLSQQELVDLCVSGAHLALNDGTMFGEGGEGFMRLNVGCTRALLEKAMINLKKAVEKKLSKK